MEIRILNGGRGRDINAAIMNAALNAGLKVSLSKVFFRFDVDEWSTFLSVFWWACSTFSMYETISEKSSKVHVTVLTELGRVYQTDVWYSPKHKGVHYVSLY